MSLVLRILAYCVLMVGIGVITSVCVWLANIFGLDLHAKSAVFGAVLVSAYSVWKETSGLKKVLEDDQMNEYDEYGD